MIRAAWILGGILCVGLGVIGLFLPFLPTVPFLLAAAFCFGRSSERLHQWLLRHPRLGPPVRDWNERGAISPRAKRFASASVAAALVTSAVLGFAPLVIAVQAVALVGVMIFIWTRPDG